MATLFVRKDGKVFGPLEVEQVAEALTNGQIGPRDEVSKDGAQWHPVAKVSGQILAAAAKPPAASAPHPAPAPTAPPAPQVARPPQLPPRPQTAPAASRPVPPLPLHNPQIVPSVPSYAPPYSGYVDPMHAAPRRMDLNYSGALGTLLSILLPILSLAWFAVAGLNVHLSLEHTKLGEKMQRERGSLRGSAVGNELLALAATEQQNTMIVMGVMGLTLVGLTILAIWHVRGMTLVASLGSNYLGLPTAMIIISYLIPPLNFLVPAVGLKQLWRSALGPRDDSRPATSGTTPVTIWAALRFCGFVGTVVMAWKIFEKVSSITPGIEAFGLGAVMKEAAPLIMTRAGTIALYAASIGVLAFVVMRIENLLAKRVKREAV